MKYRGLFFLLQAVILVAAAPVHDDSQAALVLEALEDAASDHVQTASSQIYNSNPFYMDTLKEKLEDKQDLILNIAGDIINYAKKKATRNPPFRVQRIRGDTHSAAHKQILSFEDIDNRYKLQVYIVYSTNILG